MAKKVKPFSAVIFFLILLTAVFFLGLNYLLLTKETSNKVTELNTKKQKIKVYLVVINGNGESGKLIGCGDSLVSLEREIPQTKAVLKSSLEELLSLKERTYQDGSLYNALAGSKLRLDTVSIDGNGLVKIELSGTYKFTGVCEDARFISQIDETARQISTVKEVEIFLNGRSLKNLYKN